MAKRKIDSRSKSGFAQKASKNCASRKSQAPLPQTNTKQADVISLLSRPQGTTISAIMNSTGWRQHSVRGFLAGVVRKKLGLALKSEKKDGADRIYRIVTRKLNDREAA